MQSSVISGQLSLIVMRAELTHDTETIGKMDPYVKIKYNGKQYKSQTKTDAGKKPVWNFHVNLFVALNDEISIKVMDKDTFSDDVIGKFEGSVRTLIGESRAKEERWIDIYYGSKNKIGGRILVQTQFEWPEGKSPAELKQAKEDERSKELVEAAHWKSQQENLSAAAAWANIGQNTGAIGQPSQPYPNMYHQM